MIIRNNYTQSLLKYSAERDDCIGRPERWGSPPPLVVSSPLHDELQDLAKELWAGPKNPIWYFLVGGPGNGKSEAVGQFVRSLNALAKNAGAPAVFDAKSGKHGASIPYWFHENIPSGGITLLQDASVPKNSGSDPAVDLLTSLELCSNPGGNLIACANRGMLLRATRLARDTPAYHPLLQILEAIDKQSQESATGDKAKWRVPLGGKDIEVRVWPLDHESVLFGQGNGNPWAEPAGSLLDKIVEAATDKVRWEDNGCSTCPARELCPMLADAKWLRDGPKRHAMLKILRHAEVYSGQRIVLREALGFVSMVLVGCPSDFVSAGTELHPCEWVQQRVSGSPAKPTDDRALLELVSRRVYQDLFGRSTPTGLAVGREHGRRDTWILERISTLDSEGEKISRALVAVDSGFAKQTGPLRLVGRDGILQPFDPSKDGMWCSKHSFAIDGEIDDLRKIGLLHQCQLEQELGDLFLKLEKATRIIEPHKDPAKTFAAIYRWASTVYLRLAGTALGETPNSDSIVDYLALLQQPTGIIQASGKQTTLRELMKNVASVGTKVEMAHNFVSELQAVPPIPIKARPRNQQPRWPANDKLSLDTNGSTVALAATTFVDAWRKYALDVAEWSISPAMGNLMRAWRGHQIVVSGQFRHMQSVEFVGKPSLEYEFLGPTEVQVRSK